MKSRTYKGLLSLFLCFILLFTGEVPAYAQGIAGIKERQEQARLEKEEETLRQEREAAIFAVQEGITLSSNFLKTEETFTGTETGETGQEETGESGEDAPAEDLWETETGFDGEQDGTPLRQPETEALSEELYGELVETGEYYKTYRLPDGTYKTLFTAYSNTYEENGEEKPIDNTLVSGNGAEDGTYTNKANDIDVTFYGEESGEAALSVSTEGMEALLKPLEGDYGKAAVSENAIRYNGVFENTDMQYTVEPDGVKQDIILLAPSDKTGFTYSLKKEGILARLEDNCICLYENTETTISGNALSDSIISDSTISGNTIADGTLSGNTIGNSVSGNTINASPLMVISAPGMEDALGAFSSDVIMELSETEDAWLIT
ncbi:MAG: hypothetical protein HDR00_15195, partial [Lachnospiraceae bacterium]|nr:hypothetical protein [Lachnospiraceae bacterium]